MPGTNWRPVQRSWSTLPDQHQLKLHWKIDSFTDRLNRYGNHSNPELWLCFSFSKFLWVFTYLAQAGFRTPLLDLGPFRIPKNTVGTKKDFSENKGISLALTEMTYARDFAGSADFKCQKCIEGNCRWIVILGNSLLIVGHGFYIGQIPTCYKGMTVALAEDIRVSQRQVWQAAVLN